MKHLKLIYKVFIDFYCIPFYFVTIIVFLFIFLSILKYRGLVNFILELSKVDADRANKMIYFKDLSSEKKVKVFYWSLVLRRFYSFINLLYLKIVLSSFYWIIMILCFTIFTHVQ